MEFKLPEIGEGVHEGELIRWLVKDGDTVTADQPLIEVMTDKATVEVPAPSAGVISGITAKDGQMIKVGQTLAQIASDGAAKAAPEASAEAKPAVGQKSEPEAKAPAATAGEGAGVGAAQGAGVGAEAIAQPPAPAKSANGAAPQNLNIPPQGASRASNPGAYTGANDANKAGNVAAAPIVRAMAQKAGVDLGQVQASGPQGRVLEEDLLKFLASGQIQPAAPAQSGSGGGGLAIVPTAPTRAPQPAAPMTYVPPARNIGSAQAEERKPLRGLRRVIAAAMVKSKFTAPHYSYVDEFECSSLVELREQSKKTAEKFGLKFTYLPFVVKAVVGALKEFPSVNASLEDGPDGQVLVMKKYYNIGIAVATPEGLVVPVIKNADQKSLLDIAAEIQTLSEKTRNGKATSDELKGSTFSITSMGNVGGLFATPIINYPEVGIMGVYKIQEKPIVKDGAIVVGKTMHLSLSLDHRVVDGVVGAEFCNAVIARLSNPARLMLEMI